MALESVKPVRGTSGSVSGDSIERSIRYRVKFTTELEDSVAAETVVIATYGLTINQTPYFYGGSIDPRAKYRELRSGAAREKRVYYVDAIFRSDAAQQGDNRDPPEDPASANATVRTSHRGEPKALHKSFFRGFRNAAGGTIQPGNNRMQTYRDLPITNSAEVPLLPPREKTIYYPAFLVTFFTQRIYDVTLKAVGTINLGPFRLRTVTAEGEIQFNSIFADLTIAVMDENWTPLIANGVLWHQVEVELLYNSDGWLVNELDQGLCARAQKGDPDGTGGDYSNTDILEFRADAVPAVRRLLDGNGNPITDPVPLDGNGQPLNSDNPEDAVFLQWQDQDEATLQNRFGPPFYAV